PAGALRAAAGGAVSAHEMDSDRGGGAERRAHRGSRDGRVRLFRRAPLRAHARGGGRGAGRRRRRVDRRLARVRARRRSLRRAHPLLAGGGAARGGERGGGGLLMQSSDIESLLASRDPEERRQATASLFGRASDSPAGAARLVLRALGDDDWRVRKEAVAAALALSPSRELLDQLVSALGAGDNVGLRNAAVEAIAGYGQEAVEALLQALPSLDADGRKLAAAALGRTGRDSAVPVLVPLLRDEDPNGRIAAVEAPATVGRAGIGEVVPLLESCLYSDEPLLVLAALDGLNALGAVLPFGTVSRFFESALLKRSALVAAGRTRDPRVVAPLLECLETATGRGFLDLVFSLCELARGRRAGDELRRAGALLSTKTSARLAALVNDEYTHEELRRAALVVVAALGLDGAVALALGALSDERFLAEAHEAIELLGDTALAALVRAV